MIATKNDDERSFRLALRNAVAGGAGGCAAGLVLSILHAGVSAPEGLVAGLAGGVAAGLALDLFSRLTR